MIIKRQSIIDGTWSEMDLDITDEQALLYLEGNTHIQKIFSYLSAGEREFIRSGITPEQWIAEFGTVDKPPVVLVKHPDLEAEQLMIKTQDRIEELLKQEPDEPMPEDDKILVYVRSGVAECDDHRVLIIDCDKDSSRPVLEIQAAILLQKTMRGLLLTKGDTHEAADLKDKLTEHVELCLQEIERGGDIDSCVNATINEMEALARRS